MKKQQLKPISNDAVSEIKRHFDVVAEGLNDKISIIAEQYGDIKEVLDSHTEMIGAMAEDIEVIKLDIEFIKGDLKKKVNYEEFMALERRVSFVESKARR